MKMIPSPIRISIVEGLQPWPRRSMNMKWLFACVSLMVLLLGGAMVEATSADRSKAHPTNSGGSTPRLGKDRTVTLSPRPSSHRRRSPAWIHHPSLEASTEQELVEATKSGKAVVHSWSPSSCPRGNTNVLKVRGGVEYTTTNAAAGIVVLALLEQAVKTALQKANLQFPAMLGACIFLFVGLIFLEMIQPAWSQAIFLALSPGAALLAKWLPVFFVPGLAMLPLSPPIGGSVEVLKVLSVVSLGFVYTLTSTAYAVLAVRKAQGTLTASAGPSSKTVRGPVAKPFSDALTSFLIRSSVAMGLVSVWATRSGQTFATPVQTIFLFLATLASYTWGARLPASFTKVVHPLVTSSVLVIALTRLLAMAVGKDFLKVMAMYRVKSLHPMKAGAGDIFMFLLGPSVVSFAISVYSRRDLIRSNFLVVITAMLVSSIGGLFGTAAFVRAISLGGRYQGRLLRLSVLARNVTTALSMALTAMMGGDISIAAIVVALTGSIGATYGKPLLTALGIVDPVCRGLAIGASSQGLGVAAIVDEPDAFPFAAVSMVLTAISATTVVCIPAIKRSLIQLATGATP